MPYIEVKTNVHVTETMKSELHDMLGEKITLIPGKTERWLMTDVSGDRAMSFAGDTAGCAMVEVALFGKATNEAYDALTDALCESVGAALNIPCDRVYVKYEEVSHWGWNKMNI
ncbi:MAG: hypothetical protein IKW68_02315 [Clostridia bacterium]|nr:hypothetical protein [Clostridia bacterium]